MNKPLRGPARLFAPAAPITASLPARVAVAALVVGASFLVWRLAFAGLGSGTAPLGEIDGTRLVVSQFGLTEDVIWAIDASDPESRVPLATAPHAAGYGVYAALSPDGRSIAYTALPPAVKNPSADTPAELWALDLSTGESRLLASDADLLVTPVWSPDGGSVVFRRSETIENAAGTFALVEASLAGGESTLVEADAALFPVGFDGDGALLYTTLSPAGTDLARVSPGAAAVTLGRLSEDFTRDWTLSPDGTRVAFLAPDASAGAVTFRASIAELRRSGERIEVRVSAALSGPAADVGPAWHPDGDLTVTRISRTGAALLLEEGRARALEEPDGGFDVPLTWSPEGDVLAVREFEGGSAEAPGAARLTLVEADGGRDAVDVPGDVAIVGWLRDE